MSQMQTFSFAPPNLGLGDNKKNYVFVDEHNRHKRLKVMRACEGCRRRKIKCDAATNNSWPCAACVRLKLHCVPPTVNYDRTHTGSSNISGLERVLDFDNSSGSGDEDYSHHTSAPQVFELDRQPGNLQSHQGTYGDGLGVFHTPPYSDRALSHHDFSSYDDVPAIPLRVSEGSFQEQSSFNMSTGPTLASSGSSPTWSGENFSAAGLSSILGELKIDESGVAPYISQQKKSLADAPALEEFEVKLPATATGSGSTVRIPPELMPSEEQCMEWFDIFFNNIHPYVPVISKPQFYGQWHTNPRLISPLILEAIFACAGRMSDDPAQGAQWLALASKHEDCFMDVPRLSTIQALLLLLKARESAPKRGYYYRSWMTVKKLVTMAKDLELHEHYAEHQAGRDCEGADLTECLIKTRIWQSIFICEIMIGGPQGRYDMEVDPESVDFRIIQGPLPGIDQSDYQVSRQYTHFTRMVRSVRSLNNIYDKVKKQQNWGADPQFTQLNPTVMQWLKDLPQDLQVTFPDDETLPWLPSHFVANMHSYHHLIVIMLHRPQLMSSSSFTIDGSWKKHMALSYASAKAMCRLQESILQSFGLPGLLCMMRGINFVIYAVLTCTMIHLVAITSPDPDFNTDAKNYFTRHMRLLENCTSAWPMPDMQTQIDALREAFSADTSRPFELKPSFPYGSPGSNLQPSPPLDMKYQHNNLSRQTSHEQSGQIQFHPHPLTPPISGEHEDQGRPLTASLMMANGQQQPMPLASTSIETDQATWNPTRIFDQWTAAFGTSSSMLGATNHQLSEPSPPLYTPTSVGSHDLPPLHDAMQRQQYAVQSSMPPLSRIQSVPSQPSYTSAGPSFVTSSMWRDTVANTYDPGGLKRRWDMESNFLIEPVPSKRSR